jgi:hypothetical protein
MRDVVVVDQVTAATVKGAARVERMETGILLLEFSPLLFRPFGLTIVTGIDVQRNLLFFWRSVGINL